MKGESRHLSTLNKRYLACREDKKSILCIGLDPALPTQRAKNVIPRKFWDMTHENQARLEFCRSIIAETHKFCCAYKPNQQYIAGFAKEDHQALTAAIKEGGAISILDSKLNDIEDTMESALFHIHQWGYDAITFNPFLGNLESIVKLAHRFTPEIGLFVLTLTSNIEGLRYQKEAKVHGKAVYLVIAGEIKQYHADGCIVGATGHVTKSELNTIRTIAGNEKIILLPGIGTQEGDPSKAINAAGHNILINVGRDIIYSEDPKVKAKKYNDLFNTLREGL